MPIAFTAEERTVLTGQLLESTRRFVKEQSARKVTIKQLTDSVGISKGAFYLFYPSKEHLFYALLRQMHTELYGPAMELLEQPKGTPAQQLTCAILEGCRALEKRTVPFLGAGCAGNSVRHPVRRTQGATGAGICGVPPVLGAEQSGGYLGGTGHKRPAQPDFDRTHA